MDSRRQEFLREDGRHSGVRRGCGVNRCTARWLVGTWHHHRFKGKVEIVGYCLENDAIAGNWCALVRAQQAASSRQWATGSKQQAWLVCPGEGAGRLRQSATPERNCALVRALLLLSGA
ncbi:hypothetical protein QL285_016691 [Trifolium repens]|nr:hypothetical protein QL285_016691 [Trifolium repens]